MSDKTIKILKNVFLSTNENQLKIVDIHFSDRVEKIIYRTSKDLDWKEIKSTEKRNKFVQQISDSEYPSHNKIYDGEYLDALDVSPGDNLADILVKINNALTTTTTTTTVAPTTTTTTTLPL